MAGISIKNLSKRYATTAVVSDVSLEIADGEFVALLGPSGCGKTTLLRLIAGLERPEAGQIVIGDEIMVGPGVFVEPERRELGMVFQSYALWPNMSVGENVAFGLRVRRMPAEERMARVAEALATVGLAGFADRRPHELSGGQRQRTALARCLALRPRLILLDEPLANLDAHLRRDMQREFRRIHREAGTTFVFVTHDQREAMALADRIAVMDHGRLQQVGTPEALYQSPATRMVAAFIAGGALLPVTVAGRLDMDRVSIEIGGSNIVASGRIPGGRGWLCIRPDTVEVTEPGTGHLAAIVRETTYQGDEYALELEVSGLGGVMVEARSLSPIAIGTQVGLRIGGGWVLPEDEAA
jgi:iron(III) transport system ATP-binding protein